MQLPHAQISILKRQHADTLKIRCEVLCQFVFVMSVEFCHISNDTDENDGTEELLSNDTGSR